MIARSAFAGVVFDCDGVLVDSEPISNRVFAEALATIGLSLSPDALTGMEANLRFPLPENQATRIFGRLSAWQNWIFIRPNATGEKGALKVYGSGAQPKFDWERV